MATTVGVVGVGNMGSALVKGWLRSGDIELLVWDTYRPAVEKLCAVAPVIEAAPSLERVAGRADTLVIVVKPKDAGQVLAGLKGALRSDQTVVSAMAGLTLEWLRETLGPGPTLIRVMPNLAVELGAGAVALSVEQEADEAAVKRCLALFGRLGLAEVIPEEQFDVFTAVSGSSPAFFALTVEGLEDGAVAAGLGRADARRVVRQTALDMAQRLVEHGDSPAEGGDGPAGAEQGAPDPLGPLKNKSCAPRSRTRLPRLWNEVARCRRPEW